MQSRACSAAAAGLAGLEQASREPVVRALLLQPAAGDPPVGESAAGGGEHGRGLRGAAVGLLLQRRGEAVAADGQGPRCRGGDRRRVLRARLGLGVGRAGPVELALSAQRAGGGGEHDHRVVPRKSLERGIVAAGIAQHGDAAGDGGRAIRAVVPGRQRAQRSEQVDAGLPAREVLAVDVGDQARERDDVRRRRRARLSLGESSGDRFGIVGVVVPGGGNEVGIVHRCRLSGQVMVGGDAAGGRLRKCGRSGLPSRCALRCSPLGRPGGLT